MPLWVLDVQRTGNTGETSALTIHRGLKAELSSMIETIQAALARLRDFMEWAPGTVVGVVILAIAVVLALLLHSAVFKLLQRIVRRRHPFVVGVLTGTWRLGQIGFVVAALFIALPVAPFDRETTTVLAYVLLIAAIVLIGCTVITATHVMADLYLLRFRLDVADNLLARKHVTQIRVLRRVVDTLLIIVTIGAVLMTFEPVRQYGVSLFASAGVAGLVVGFAARPVLSNLIAGIQLAMTQPIRIDDAVLVENEFGNVEEITATYVVLRLWDLRRMIVPLTYFIEKPFQNWSRESTSLIGTVLLKADYTTPVERVRAKAEEIVKASPLWDGNLIKLQVTDSDAETMELRVIVTARSAGDAFDLRCELREKLIAYLQAELPGALPRRRQEASGAAAVAPPAPLDSKSR
ncbi:MAG TPA: mechanosensitive ion channel domain-containing protein [Xanthobacteraceae bacterium]|nr:mechanosensitive ion channel domain-containing protein [Xanthobacteraceae bacterium]